MSKNIDMMDAKRDKEKSYRRAIAAAVLFLLTGPWITGGASAGETREALSAKERQDLDFADGLYQRKMYETAAQKYAEFIRKYPACSQRDSALFRRGESLYQFSMSLGENDPIRSKVILVEARNVFQDYIRTYSKGEKIYDALIRHGEVSYKIGDAKGGITSLLRTIKEAKQPALVEAAVFFAARCYESLENYDEAGKRYRQIRDTYPKGEYAAFATYLLAELLSKQGKNTEAANLLNDLWQHPDKYVLPQDSTLIEDAQLLSAQILYRMDRFGEAAKAYQAYVAEHPEGENAAKAKYGAAWAEYRRENYGEALAIAKTLQRQSLPGDLEAGIIFLQGTCAYQQKLYDEAIIYFREVVADPKAGEYRQRAWYQLSWSYYQTGRYEEAVQQCRILLQQTLSPSESSNAHFLLGQSYARQEDYHQAISEMRLVSRIHAGGDYVEDALYLLADLLYLTGQYAESGETFTRFYETYRKATRAKEALSWAVNAFFAGKDYPKAILSVDLFLKQYTDRENRFDLLYRKALAQYQLKDYKPALETLREIIVSKEDNRKKAEALYWTAYILELTGERKRASETYGRLVQEYPKFKEREEVRLRKALCDYHEKEFAEAYREFRIILASDLGTKLSPEVIFWMVFYANENGQHEEALRIAERIYTIFEQPALRERALIAKGNQLVALKHWKKALSNAETFLERFPQSKFKPEIYWSRAKALEGSGKPEEALKLYNDSLLGLQNLGSPDPSFEATIYVDRGRLLESLDRTGEALESFLRVAIIYDHPTLTPEAMYRSMRCHIALEEKKEAGMIFKELQQRYRDSSWCEKAKQEFAQALRN